MSGNRQTPAARRNSDFRRACALAALLALTLLQVSWAGHQFQHHGGEMLEVCGICMQLDRVDQFLSPVEHLLLDEPIVFAYCTELLPSEPSSDPLAYESRAAPTV